MNLPALLPVLDELGIENPIVCSNINKIGFRMCGGAAAYEDGAARAPLPCDGDVGLRLGRDPGARGDRVGLRAAERGVDRLRRLEPRATSRARGRSSPSTGVSSTEHAPRRLHRRAPEAAAPAAPATRRRRGPVSLGDLRHAAEPLAARRRARSTSSPSSAAATRSTCRATSRPRAGSSREHEIDTVVSTGFVDGPAVLRARPCPAARPATTSRAPPAARGRR